MNVSIVKSAKCVYPINIPFHPDKIYPELHLLKNKNKLCLDGKNYMYSMVRESFANLCYDIENYGKETWNPLGWLIKQEETVFIKPNMIAHKHLLNDDWNYLITHGSIIRAVIDYVFIAMQGKGKIIIGDAPQTNSNYTEIIKLMGLIEIRKLYSDYKYFEIELINLQDEYWIWKDGIYIDTVKLAGDPKGNIKFSLDKQSYFSELDGQGKLYYGAFYDINETNEHHHDGVHEYLVSKSPIVSDVFINIPKLKTHKKCGITVNLKSLVGINANKNWLPHYIFGSKDKGGDQFKDDLRKNCLENILVLQAKKILLSKNSVMQFIAKKLKSSAYRFFGSTEEVIRSGNWYGNDTVWRMVLDLNKILLYGNYDGSFRNKENPKKYFSIVDGIYSMEGNGPQAGEKKETGVIIAGEDPVAIDSVCTKIMGFDYKKLNIIMRSFDQYELPLTKIKYEEIQCKSNIEAWNKNITDIEYKDTLKFKPHFGWLGHIELE